MNTTPIKSQRYEPKKERIGEWKVDDIPIVGCKLGFRMSGSGLAFVLKKRPVRIYV